VRLSVGERYASLLACSSFSALLGSLVLRPPCLANSTLAATRVAYHTVNADGQRMLDERMLNAVLVLMLVASALGPVLTQRFAPHMLDDEAHERKGYRLVVLQELRRFHTRAGLAKPSTLIALVTMSSTPIVHLSPWSSIYRLCWQEYRRLRDF
jgi:Na+/H+ antiporter NhaC